MSQNLDKRGYSITDVCRMYGISRQLVYDEINNGNLKTLKIGNRRIIPPRSLDEWEKAKSRTG